MLRVPIERLRSQTEVVLPAGGMPQNLAALTAEVIAEAEVTGVARYFPPRPGQRAADAPPPRRRWPDPRAASAAPHARA